MRLINFPFKLSDERKSKNDLEKLKFTPTQIEWLNSYLENVINSELFLIRGFSISLSTLISSSKEKF
jgi:hypothetical protein